MSDDETYTISKKIIDKKRKYNILNVINFGILIGLVLFGTVSIMKILMMLYETFKLSIGVLIIMNIGLPYIYSLVVKNIIKFGDNKSKNLMLEIEELELKEEIELEKDKFIENIRIRFDGLSKNDQLLVLNYIKDDCLSKIYGVGERDELSSNDILMLVGKLDKIQEVGMKCGYTRMKMRDTENKRIM